jgi:aspartate racemase
MTMIGVLGGMGPAATVDFMGKLVTLTPAQIDQEHLPVLVANLPQLPDRSRFILGEGPDPLPHLLRGIELLNRSGVGLTVVPCNTAHHWFAQMAAHSEAPMLHIGHASLAALPEDPDLPVSLFATRGTLRSGFYQRELRRRGVLHTAPAADGAQHSVDECIRAVKAGDLPRGSAALELALADARARGVKVVIMACTEIPVAARSLHCADMQLIDSSLELARHAAAYAIGRGWHRAPCEPELPIVTPQPWSAPFGGGHPHWLNAQ